MNQETFMYRFKQTPKFRFTFLILDEGAILGVRSWCTQCLACHLIFYRQLFSWTLNTFPLINNWPLWLEKKGMKTSVVQVSYLPGIYCNYISQFTCEFLDSLNMLQANSTALYLLQSRWENQTTSMEKQRAEINFENYDFRHLWILFIS